jgi:cation-transporting ATPase 13A1
VRAGWGDARRNRWKLLLHCIMIITSVVPPELPIELSLAVNSSVATLMRVGIFCTEPWRITLAGQVDVACFDKTGTITADEFNVDGIVGLLGAGAGAAGEEPAAVLIHPSRVPAATRLVLAGCHALMPLQQRAAGAAASGAVSVVGDPMERSAFIAAGAIFLSDGSVSVLTPADASKRVSATSSLLRVVKRWPFSSALKRMSCAIDVTASTAPASSASSSASCCRR